MSQEFVAWLMVALVGGIVCSPDGMMAVVCNYRHIDKMKVAITWVALITMFHEIFGCLSAAVTFYATDYYWITYIVRLVGIIATGYFAHKSILEALEPGDEMRVLKWKEMFLTTALVGSVDATSFAHGTTIHLIHYGFWGVMANWTMSSLIVGMLTFSAAFAALKFASFLKSQGPAFLILGAVARIGLFFCLIAMLIIALGENMKVFHLSHGIKIFVEIGVLVLFSAIFYGPARAAQLRKLEEKQRQLESCLVPICVRGTEVHA